MNKVMVFANRNIKETMRSPVSWLFGLLLPIGLFIVMQVIIKSIGGEAAANVPMFGVERFTGGVVLFGSSFLSLFCAMLISGDRQTSFLARLFASPLKSAHYILGYTVGVLPIAAVQVVITYVTAMCFGLTLTVNILPAMLFSFIISLLFIAIGVIFGSLLSSKNAPPLCSVVVQVAALLSGMWFDLEMIGGGFNVFCHILPFAHCLDLIRYTLAGDWQNVWLPVLVVVGYTAALIVSAIMAFRYRSRRI